MSEVIVMRNARIGLGGAIADLRIESGVVTEIGSLDNGTGPDVDVAGRTVLPGLVDAHVHMTQWAETRRRIDVSAANSAREVAAQIASAAESADASELLFAYGFRDGLWSDLPHKSVLDEALPGGRVIALSNDLHAVWLSQAALSVVGESSHPTGVFREAEARAVQSALPRASDEERDRWVVDAASQAANRGVTGIIDFEVADNLRDWTRRLRRFDIPLRVTCTIYPEYLDDAIAAGLRTGDAVPGTRGRAIVGPVKIILDGSLNTRTALCHDPYADDSHGLQLVDTADLQEIMARSAAHGLEPAVHAIGDEANTIALDAFERVGCAGRIEHAQLLGDDDVVRMGRLGLVAGVQPAHVTGDRDVAERTWPGRTAKSFRYADLLAAGVRLEIGSDAPVTPLDPWDGVAAAVTRDDGVRGAWHPEQCIPLEAAITAASAGKSTLSVGDAADLVMLGADPTAFSPDALRTMPVSGTLVGGRWTHRCNDPDGISAAG